MIKFLILLACLFIAPCSSNAGQLEDIFAKAQNAYKENNLDEAAASFNQVVDLLIKQKQIPQARIVLGNVAAIYIKQEKYAAAINVYNQALELKGKADPKFQNKAWGNLAVCHHYLNEFALKAQYLEKLIKASPKEKNEIRADWYAQLGDAYKALEIYSKAAAAYENAAKLLPKEQKDTQNKILTAWALCAGNLGDFAKAETLLSEVLKNEQIEPLTKAESSSNLGILKWEQGDYVNASELISNALEIEKTAALRRNEGVDTNNYGLILKSAGKYEEALTCFNNSISIALEVNNTRDEAIALSNMALVSRILGDYNSAKNHYTRALALYEQANFKEGKASTLLGLGKIAELSANDYNTALNHYRDAYAIYEELQIPRGMAESLNQMGRALRKAAAPQRATRDLVFDDEEITLPQIEPAAALKESVESYQKALTIAEKLGTKELIWTAYQGLGFALNEEGKKAEALDYYEKAISFVTSMRASQADSELLGEYLKDKKDLYTEAMEICSALYSETQKPEYMFRAMELDEILRNEIVKASAQSVQMNYAEKDKQDLYSKIINVSAQQNKASSNIPVAKENTDNLTNEQKEQNRLVEEETKTAKSNVNTLEKTYNELLAEWKKRYPEDAAFFDSSAKVDTNIIQQKLAQDELVLNYINLPDSLIIVSIAKEFVHIYTQPVAEKDLDRKIKTDLLYKTMEIDGRALSKGKGIDAAKEQEAFQRVLPLLHEMYEILIKPIEQDMQNKDKLLIISSGFLASFPFMALADDISNPLQTEFLIERKEIVNARLSFFNQNAQQANKLSDITLLAAGNPRNDYVPILPNLPGAENEIKTVSEIPGLNSPANNIKYKEEATETWFKNSLRDSQYPVIYLATHGMPFSDTYAFYKNFDKKQDGNEKKEQARPSINYMREHLIGISPLNGYIYMASSDEDDGLLTVKELLELPASYFNHTELILLSACNTGVTFVPKSLKDDEMINEYNSETIQKEMVKLGWTPGVDQVSFVDSLMRKGVAYSYGTLWFADDLATSYVLKSFAANLNGKTVPSAYAQTIREYLKLAKEQKLDLGNGYPTIPQHPFFWACGTIFGN